MQLSKIAPFLVLCLTTFAVGCSDPEDDRTGNTKPDAGNTVDGGSNPDGGNKPDGGGNKPDGGGSTGCDSTLGTGDEVCDECLQDKCCAEMTDCENDEDCLACLDGDEAACAAASDLLNALDECFAGDCGSACLPPEPTNCQEVLEQNQFPEGCSTCLQGACCDEVFACHQADGCIECISGEGPQGCENAPATAAVLACAQTSCEFDCFNFDSPDFTDVAPACNAPEQLPTTGTCVPDASLFECNPVTNSGCAAGEACDFEANGFFMCFPDDNTELLCAACSNAEGPFCQPGHTCVNGQCARYCCDDSECGTDSVCDRSFFRNTAGICVPATPPPAP